MALPRYGNWGGPGYSAGHDCLPGQPLSDDDKGVKGIDPMDELFKQHDLAYEQAEELGRVSELAEKLATLKADQDLVDGLKALDKDDPDTFNHPIVGMNYYIILDLDGDGVETIGLSDGAYFDHGGDGFAEQTGWAGSDDGLLVYDLNGNGRIETGSELFGSNTLLANGNKAINGFSALAELDSNHDGKIDANDTAFAHLRVWKDVDGDGYTFDGELHTLELFPI